MYKFLIVLFSFVALSACVGEPKPTYFGAVLPNFTLEVLPDNSAIRLNIDDSGLFDRVTISRCNFSTPGTCSTIVSASDRFEFLFTTEQLGYNLVESAKASAVPTDILRNAFVYSFLFVVTADDPITGVRDRLSTMMSVTTHDLYFLHANASYADVSHTTSSFNTSFNLMDAIRTIQILNVNDAMYRYNFDNFILRNRSGIFHPSGFDGCGQRSEYDDLFRRSDHVCTTSSIVTLCGGAERSVVSWSCTRIADVEVSIPGRLMWSQESADAEPVFDDHPDVACTYTRPANYIRAAEPAFTNGAIDAGIIVAERERRFYGFDVGAVDTEISFMAEDSEVNFNEDLSFTTNDDGDRVFAFDSAYSVDEDVEQIIFRPSVNLFTFREMGIEITCSSGGETSTVSASVDPTDIYTPLPVLIDNKIIRAITYRVPLSVSFNTHFSKPFSVILPFTYDGFRLNSYVRGSVRASYDFYNDLADGYFDNRGFLYIPNSLLTGPLYVNLGQENEERYLLNVINQYVAE